MPKNAGSNSVAQKIINYQEKHHLTDAEFALASHFTVEKIHGFKVQTGMPPTEEERKALLNFIHSRSVHS